MMIQENRICMALDLNDNPALIAEYKRYHEPGNVWKEVIESIHNAGVENMQIYLSGNRLFMIMEIDDTFTLEKKAAMDLANARVQEWEDLMQSKFQKALPWEKKIKWVQMDLIFNLQDHTL